MADLCVLVPKSQGDNAYGGSGGPPSWLLSQLAGLMNPGPSDLVVARHVSGLRLHCSITVANAGGSDVAVDPERLVNLVKTVQLNSPNSIVPVQLADNAGLSLYHAAWSLTGRKPAPAALVVPASGAATAVFDLEIPLARLPLGSRTLDPAADPEVWKDSTLSIVFGDGSSGKMFASGVTVSAATVNLYADANYDARPYCAGLPLEFQSSGLPSLNGQVASFAQTRPILAMLIKAQADGSNSATKFTSSEITSLDLQLGGIHVWSNTGDPDEINRQFNNRAVASLYDARPSLQDSGGTSCLALVGPLDRGQSNLTEKQFCSVDPQLAINGSLTVGTARFAYLRARNSVDFAAKVANSCAWKGRLAPILAGDAQQIPDSLAPFLPYCVIPAPKPKVSA